MSLAGESAALEFDHLPEAWSPEAFIPRRPIGLAAVAALIAAAGFILILGAIFYLFATLVGGIAPSGMLPSPVAILESLSPFGALIVLAFGATLIGIGTALWRQETWSFVAMVVIIFGGIAYLLVTASVTVMLVVLVLLFLYLIAVRHYFY